MFFVVGFILFQLIIFHVFRETIDVVKQSAALCLLRLYRSMPDLSPSGEFTSRIVHLLNDQHMVHIINDCNNF